MLKYLLASLLAIIGSNALAVEASDESIERLLIATKANSTAESIYPIVDKMIRESLEQRFSNTDISQERRQAIGRIPERLTSVLRTEISWDVMKPKYIKLYKDTFTQEEIDGLIAFYESDAGKAFTNKMPVLMQGIMQMMQEMMESLKPKIKQATDEIINDIERSE